MIFSKQVRQTEIGEKKIKKMLDIWNNISSKGAEFNVTSSVSAVRSMKIFGKILINSQKKLKVSFDEIFCPSTSLIFPFAFYVSLELLRYRMHWEVKGISKGYQRANILTKIHFQLFSEFINIFFQNFGCYEKLRRCLSK